MADLGQLVDCIEQRSEALSALGYRVRFDLTDGGSILVDATGGGVNVSTGEGGEADTVMKLSSDNLLNPSYSRGRWIWGGERSIKH